MAIAIAAIVRSSPSPASRIQKLLFILINTIYFALQGVEDITVDVEML